MSSQIIAKRIRLILKNGQVKVYTHVICFDTFKTSESGRWIQLHIVGETDDVDGSRCNVIDNHYIKDLLTMDVEFYIPVM